MTRESFRGRTVVVTGASSGIGKALALRLADEGAWLTLAARNAQRLEALAVECEQRGGKAIAIPTDVAVEPQCRTLIQRTKETYGHVDMLINNAGMAVVSKLEDLPDLHLFKQVMDVNFYGTVHCTYYALPYLVATGGRIVNISSLGGVLGAPYNSSYVASKFAVNGFSDSLRMELKKSGVSVTTICPYWVVTEFHERYLDEDGRPKGPSGREIYAENTMTADECAQIILKAALRRKRQVVMQPGPLALWLKLLAPSLVDRLLISMLRRTVKRTS
ncbi:MAG: SDR family oxidoreductase, partial [Anaerolineae bacterium]|nr:SDR family oxidoreductase [Anaerolineae bacterium]